MDSGLDKPFLRRCLWMTGWVSAFVALVGWQLTGFDWAGRYAAVALFAWINWVFLAWLLGALVEGKRRSFVLALGGNLVNLAWFVGLYLPQAGAEPISALAGINTFFFVVLMKLLGRRFVGTNSLSFSQSPAPPGAGKSPTRPWS